jgi:hypothetical protein
MLSLVNSGVILQLEDGGLLLQRLAFHFGWGFGLTREGFGHAVGRAGTGSADGRHHGFLFFHSFDGLADFPVFKNDARMTLKLIACPDQC